MNIPTLPAPSAREFAWAWSAYTLAAVGLFMFWTWIVCLLIAGFRRNEPAEPLLATHYRWQIRTFWFSMLWYTLAMGLIVASAWPVLREVLRQAPAADARSLSLSLDWTAIFATATGALVGGAAMIAIWVWSAYRLVRGMIALADARAVP